MENNQVFMKKYILKHIQTEQKEGCFRNLCIARNEELQFIWQKPNSRQRQKPYST